MQGHQARPGPGLLFLGSFEPADEPAQVVGLNAAEALDAVAQARALGLKHRGECLGFSLPTRKLSRQADKEFLEPSAAWALRSVGVIPPRASWGRSSL